MLPIQIPRQTRRKIGTLVGGAFLVWLLYKILDSSTLSLDDLHVDDGPGQSLPKHDKWIVITTINRPTEAVRLLAKIPGWKMVVVGDRKSPSNWQLDGVVYLDVKAQKRLPYTIGAMLPYDSYTRKMLGYLYAIEHGARYIFEADDDNHKADDLLSFHYPPTMDTLLVEQNNLTVNPYVHFGQSTLWPRGYPLEFVGADSSRQYKRCNLHTPAIQQGLVDGDPDVDAVFRLTRKHMSKPLKLSFDGKAPPFVLPNGVYSPFNSQNTLFSYDAFWALFLPTSVPDRNCDIYRSYFAQRLLSISGHTVGFFPPNCIQVRNFHSYIQDAIQESSMYYDMGRMVRTVQDWKCSKMHFFNCISDLAMHLVDNAFWTRRDVDALNDWLTDLASIGYIPPAVKGKPHLCTDEPLPMVFYPSEQNTSNLHSASLDMMPGTNNQVSIESHIQAFCGSHEKLPLFKPASDISVRNSILLVITIKQDLHTIPFLEAYYKPHFPHILYCGSQTKDKKLVQQWKVSYIGLAKPSPFKCMEEAMRINYKVEGYLHISDNILLNPRTINQRQITNFWMTREIFVYDPHIQSLCSQQTIACQEFTRSSFDAVGNVIANLQVGAKYLTRLHGCLKKVSSDPSIGSKATYLTDIVFYIPTRFVNIYQQMVHTLTSDSQTEELAVISVLFMECMELGPDYFEFTVFRPETEIIMKHDYIFPYPLRDIAQKTSMEAKAHFCDIVL